VATLGLGVALAAGSVAVVWLTAPSRKAAPAPAPERFLVEFTLTDTRGQRVTRQDFAGRVLVVSFAFTSCSLSCLAVNERMAELQRALAGLEDVRLVSFTVDPRTDTPKALARFAARYGADPDRWWFLTGDKAEVYRVLESSFLPRSRELETLIPGGFANSDYLMVVDRAGRVRESFPGLKPNVVAKVVAAVERLRREPVSS
jgi:cytochrome oxidase Cu insertion factor (SCO1/SenC/PrrC family)